MMKFFLAKTKNDKFQKTFKGFSRLLISKALFTNMGFRLKTLQKQNTSFYLKFIQFCDYMRLS